MSGIVKATTNEVPADTRAVTFRFKVRVGASFSVVEKSVSVTFDRYATNVSAELFASLPQMTSRAINSVIASGYEIIDYTTYFVS